MPPPPERPETPPSDPEGEFRPRVKRSPRTSKERILVHMGLDSPPTDVTPSAEIDISVRRVSKELVGGAISALVTLCFSLSFAAMIFAGDLAKDLGPGIRMALTSAAVTVTLVALLSPFRFAIAGPDSRSAAVQTALAASLATAFQGSHLPADSVLLALSISTALTGAILYAFGRLNMGNWIRYVPYPVIGGFLASTGWTLVVGAVRVVTSRPVSLGTLLQLNSPEVRLHLLVGVAFTILMLIVLTRTKHFLALPALLVLGTLAVHGVRAALGMSIEEAQDQGWLLKVVHDGSAFLPLRSISPEHFNFEEWDKHLLGAFSGGVLVLIAVTAIAVLVTGAAIEVATGTDANLDQELKSHGVANLISGLCGGIVGQNAIARSMINLQAGGTTRVSGVFAGGLCLVVDLTRPELAGLLARPIMGATLAYLGLRLLNDWVIKARNNLERTDYLLVIGILAVIIQFGFVTGLFLGLVVSCLIFAVNYSRISVIKHSFTLDEYGSKVQRSAAEHRVLHKRGKQHWVLRLRGYLFFGSVVRLVRDARQRIESSQDGPLPLRTLVLDFAAVIGIDSSSVLTLVKLRQVIQSCGMRLMFTALQPEMQRRLERERCLRGDDVCVALPDLDRALERCEETILSARSDRGTDSWAIAANIGAALGSPELAARFRTYSDRITLQKGQYLVRQGDASDEIYVIEAGRVSIWLELPAGPPLRLRSVTSNTSLGEMGLYRQSPRTASIIADELTVVLRLTRDALARMENEDPKLALAFHIFIIRTLADRLVSSDKAVATLER